MEDETFVRLQVEARQAGYPGISSYLLSKVDGLTTDAEAHDIVKRAEKLAIKKSIDDVPFTLKSLFDKERWNAYSKPARIAAGKLFFASVEAGFVSGIREGEKSGANHQTYVRVDE